MRTHFSRNIVKKRSITMSYTETEHRKTESLTINKHTFKDALFVPNYPAIHPETIFKILPEFYKRGAPQASTLCLYILTQLQRKDQNGVIQLEQTELVKWLGGSKGTVNKAVSVLEELGIITKVGKSSWKVSPRLAWVGSHVDWAEELLALETNIPNKVEVRTISIEEI
jgi:hypothetical protein